MNPTKDAFSFALENERADSTHLITTDDETSVECIQMTHESTIEDIRNHMVIMSEEDPFKALDIIDAIQRLCISHHFLNEIKEILQKLYVKCTQQEYYGRDLREVSLCFRLLRQEGHHVDAQCVFKSIQGKNGGLKEEIQNDMKGLIELFEASQLSIEGDELLETAREFAIIHLKKLCSIEESYTRQVVINIINQPCYKTLSRLSINNFVSLITLNEENKWLSSLLEVSRTDFNIQKKLHQAEISQTLTWWRGLGLAKELGKARDQPLKWYSWSMAVLEYPDLSNIRLDLVKPISFVYIIDDIFDLYGTIDELTIFTQVVERWDMDGLDDKLPRYMKMCFEALDIVTMEISLKVYRNHGWNPMKCLQKAWAKLCKAFLVEANWFAKGCIENKEEYLKNGIVSTGVPLVLTHLFFLLGENITKERVKLIESYPKIIYSAATILRLCDDLGSAQDEEQEGQDGSYIDCYIKQHKGSSVEEARTHVFQLISNEWKCLNEEYLIEKPFGGSSLAKACLNVAKTVPLMYTYDNQHQLPGLKEYLKSLMLDFP